MNIIKMLNKLAQSKQWITRILCKHLNKKEVYRNYPDAYIESKCLDCGEKIYESLE